MYITLIISLLPALLSYLHSTDLKVHYLLEYLFILSHFYLYFPLEFKHHNGREVGLVCHYILSV